MKNSRKPDFTVNALDKNTEARGRIGAAWRNDDGSISVAISYLTTLVQDGNLVVTLFPTNTWREQNGCEDALLESGPFTDSDDDVPF